MSKKAPEGMAFWTPSVIRSAQRSAKKGCVGCKAFLELLPKAQEGKVTRRDNQRLHKIMSSDISSLCGSCRFVFNRDEHWRITNPAAFRASQMGQQEMAKLRRQMEQANARVEAVRKEWGLV